MYSSYQLKPHSQAKGDKYERALQWVVPAISTDWLLRCAQHGYEAGTEEMHPP
ncbi:unnamed protein product, partial [Scytosiphon promiscuus]